MFVEISLLILFLVFLRLFVFKSRNERIYDEFPGPKPYPIVGNLLEFNYPKVEVTETFKQLSFKYGPVYLIQLGLEPVVCLRSPQDIEVILSSTTLTEKAPLYWPLYPFLNQGLLTSAGEKWRKHRKILTPAFHFKVLESFIPVFVKNSRILVDKLSKNLEKDLNLMPVIGLLSLDIITETSMALEVNAQVKDSEYVKSLNELLEIVAHRNFSVTERSFLFHWMAVGRRHDELVAYLHNVTESVIKERKDKLENPTSSKDDGITEEDVMGSKKKKVFLDLLLQYNKEGAGMTDSDIRDEVDTFMFEGYDTTTSTISFCLYCLSQNPEAQEKAYEEIQQVFGDSNRDCTYQDLQELNYLEKVIKETLRLYPTVQFIGRKANKDLKLKSGYVIPENTSIILLIEAMNHDPEAYQEPFKFDPDRFTFKNPNPYAFVPFSAGIRNCIGQKYAMLDMKAVISTVLRNFKLLPSAIPITPCFNIVMKSTTGIHVKLVPREPVLDT